MKRYILDDPTLDNALQAKYEAAKKNMIARNAAAASKQKDVAKPTNDAIKKTETTMQTPLTTNPFNWNMSFLDQAEPLTSKDQARRDVAQTEVKKARREYEDRRNPEYSKVRDMSLEEARQHYLDSRTNANK